MPATLVDRSSSRGDAAKYKDLQHFISLVYQIPFVDASKIKNVRMMNDSQVLLHCMMTDDY
jgi:hypothetical protein